MRMMKKRDSHLQNFTLFQSSRFEVPCDGPPPSKMAWRFKASKYKNAAPIVPKFEAQIRDLSLGSYRSHGNFIAASAAFMAFNWDQQVKKKLFFLTSLQCLALKAFWCWTKLKLQKLNVFIFLFRAPTLPCSPLTARAGRTRPPCP